MAAGATTTLVRVVAVLAIGAAALTYSELSAPVDNLTARMRGEEILLDRWAIEGDPSDYNRVRTRSRELAALLAEASAERRRYPILLLTGAALVGMYAFRRSRPQSA